MNLLFRQPHPDTSAQIVAAKVNALFERAKFVLITNIAIAVLVAIYLRPAVPAGNLLLWLTGIVAITASRSVLLVKYRQDPDPSGHLDYWKRVTVWGALASGLAWGMAALFPVVSLTEQLFILCVLVGMMAGAAVSWNAYFPAFMAFFIPVGLFMLARVAHEAYIRQDEYRLFIILFPMLGIFCAALFFFARNSCLSFGLLLRATEKSVRSEKYQSLFADAKITMMLIDPENGKIVAANTVACEFYGYTEARLRQMTVIDLEAAPDGETFPRESDEVFCHQLQQRTASGEIREVEVYSGPVQTGDARLLFYVVHDNTERKFLEESMRLASSIYQFSAEAILVTDANNLIVDANPAFTRITGYELDEVRGKNPSLLSSGRHDKAFYQQMWHELLTRDHWQGELWDQRKNGELCAKWVNITLIRRTDGSILRYVAQFSDITEKKKKDELIWSQANFDCLTGLPNRRLFRDRLEQEIKKVHRAEGLLALLFIDLDRFKQVNDTLGHEMGDLLLVEAARRIAACVRETDTVARLGGDEFTVILPDFGDRKRLERIVQHIIDRLNQPFVLNDEKAYISASIGITLYSDSTPDADTLLRNADCAMYVAKSQGRGRFGYFSDAMQHEANEKFSLTNDLRQALVRDEIAVFYQPIVDLLSGHIVKAEALLRWHHPERGAISPNTFIPLAEDAGLIVEIGEWVFRRAIADIGRWRQRYGRIIPVGVNKSPLQFLEKPDGMSWCELLEEQGLPGNSIVVEITEGVLLQETDEVKRQLLDFRNHMIEVSIDDFGTGFSSLSYLKKFSIDYLKIDRSFISALNEDQNSRELTECIILMAHKLGIKAIAEGVETQAQRDWLNKFGCDLAQGFLYSQAVPVADFERLLDSEFTPRLPK